MASNRDSEASNQTVPHPSTSTSRTPITPSWPPTTASIPPPTSSHPPPTPTTALAVDPRSRALNETAIDDLSGLYEQHEPRLVRHTNVEPRHQQPPFQQSNRSASTALYHPPSFGEDATSSAYSNPQPRTLPDTEAHVREPSVHTRATPRGSSLEPWPYTYVRGRDTPAANDEECSWHDSDTPTRTDSPEYSSEEEKRDPRRQHNDPRLQGVDGRYHQTDANSHAQSYDGRRSVYGEYRPQSYNDGYADPRLRAMDLERAFSPQHGSQAQAYAQPVGRRSRGAPLINQITNEWKSRPGQRHAYTAPVYNYDDEDETCCDEYGEVVRSPACRRYSCLVLIIVTLTIYFWAHWIGPDFGEKLRLKNSIKEAQLRERGFFGINVRPVLAGLNQVAAMERWKVPGSGVPRESHQTRTGNRRLIVIGDIHGCVHELQALLAKVVYDPEMDHLATTGDMITRGPASLEVLDLLIQHNASCVRGDHEDRVLLAHRDYHAPSHHKSAAEGITAEQPIKKGARSDLELASSLSAEQITYLDRCPLILDVGSVPGMGKVAIAHAGLVPLVSFERQDPYSIMSMRGIDLRNHAPSRYPPPPNPVDANGKSTGFRPEPRDKDRDRSGKTYVELWPKLWDMAQKMSPATDRTTLVYGHDETRGLSSGEWSWGLDGGCVSGGQLAALVVTGHGRGDVKREVVKVPCRAYAGTRMGVPALGGS